MEGAGEAGGALASGALSGKEALALAFAQAELIGSALEKAVKHGNALGDSAHGANKKMSELAKTAKNLGGEIAGVGKWVLKLGAGALAGLGLGALLGGFGLTGLAGAAYSRQRTAGGLGLTAGQLGSFRVNMAPWVDESTLHGVAAAQMDMTKAGSLAALLGPTWQRGTKEPATDLLVELLKSAAATYNKGPEMFLNTPQGQAWLALGGTAEEARRAAGDLATNKGAGLNKSAADYKRDIGVLGFGYGTAEAWTKFQVQLERAGMTIETVFINKLAPLVPEFTKLSAIVTENIAAFVHGIDIDAFKTGLHDFVSWLQSPELKNDLKDLGSDLHLVGAEIMAVADKLKWLIPAQSDTSEADFRNGKHRSLSDTEAAGGIIPVMGTAVDTIYGVLDGVDKMKNLGQGAWKKMREVVSGYGLPGGHPEYSSGFAAADLLNPLVTGNNLIALMYRLGRKGLTPSIGWAKTGHTTPDGPLQHAGGNAVDLEFIKGQSVDSWAGKMAALALARDPGTSSLGLDPWMRSQPGTMAQIRAAMGSRPIWNEETTHIHASAYPDSMAKHTKAIVNAVRASNQKPVQIHVRTATGANVYDAANALSSQ